MRIPLKIYAPSTRTRSASTKTTVTKESNRKSRPVPLKQAQLEVSKQRRKDDKNKGSVKITQAILQTPTPSSASAKIVVKTPAPTASAKIIKTSIKAAPVPKAKQTPSPALASPPSRGPTCETQVEVQRLDVVCEALRKPLEGHMHIIIAFLQNRKVCGLTDLSQPLKKQVDVQRASIPERKEVNASSNTEKLVALWKGEIVNNAEFYVRRRPFTFERQLSSADARDGHLELLVGVVNMKDDKQISFPVLAVGRAALQFPNNSLFRGLIEADVQLIGDFGKHRLFRIPNPKYDDISPATLTASKIGDIDYFSSLLQPFDSTLDGEIQRCYLFRTAKVHLRIDSLDKENSTTSSPQDQQQLENGYFMDKKKSVLTREVNNQQQNSSNWRKTNSFRTVDTNTTSERKPFSNFKQGIVPRNVSSSLTAGLTSPFAVLKPRKKLPKSAAVRPSPGQENVPTTNEKEFSVNIQQQSSSADEPAQNSTKDSIYTQDGTISQSLSNKSSFQDERVVILRGSLSSSSNRLVKGDRSVQSLPVLGNLPSSPSRHKSRFSGIATSASGELGVSPRTIKNDRLKASPQRRNSPIKHRTSNNVLDRSLAGPLVRQVEASLQEAEHNEVNDDQIQRENTTQATTSTSSGTESLSLLSDHTQCLTIGSKSGGVPMAEESRQDDDRERHAMSPPRRLMRQLSIRSWVEENKKSPRKTNIQAVADAEPPRRPSAGRKIGKKASFDRFGSFSGFFSQMMCAPRSESDCVLTTADDFDFAAVPSPSFERFDMGFETILDSDDENDKNENEKEERMDNGCRQIVPIKSAASDVILRDLKACGLLANEATGTSRHDQSTLRGKPCSPFENLDLMDEDDCLLGCEPSSFVMKG
ncbi:hypothetical protein ACA910_011041 [Epithemia clementina (nom. ined.)]